MSESYRRFEPKDFKGSFKGDMGPYSYDVYSGPYWQYSILAVFVLWSSLKPLGRRAKATQQGLLGTTRGYWA